MKSGDKSPHSIFVRQRALRARKKKSSSNGECITVSVSSQETALESKRTGPDRLRRKQWVQRALIVALAACLLIASVFGVRLALDRWSEPTSLDQIERLMNRQSWAKAEEQVRRYLTRHSN